MNRRTVSGLLVAGCSAAIAGIVGIPVMLSGLSPAFLSRRPSWWTVGRVRSFPVGKVIRKTLSPDQDIWPRVCGERSVFVSRISDQNLIVLSPHCTDLGCPLEYESGSGCFLCPCHGGVFESDGRPIAGPSSIPMYRYVHRIREGSLEIDVSSIPPAS